MSGFKPSTFNKYDDFLAGNAAYDPAATWLISRTSPTTGTSITFSSIPSTYKHLQIRAISRDGSANSLYLRFNSDSGTNYAAHQLRGNGASATATSNAPSVTEINSVGYGSVTASIFGATVIDILDYASTTKNKTVRTINGVDNNGSGSVFLTSGVWLSTSAVTSITITSNAGTNFTSGTTFALYGFTG